MVLYGKKQDNTYHYIAKSINKNVQRHQGETLEWHFNNVEWNNSNEFVKLFISLAEVPYSIGDDGNLIKDENGNRIELNFLEAYGDNGPLKHLHTENNGEKKYWVESYTPIVGEDGTKTYVPIKMGSLGSSGGNAIVMSSNTTGTQAFTPAFTISYTELELQPATIPHKDNSQVHLTPSEKTDIMNVPTHFNDFKTDVSLRLDEFDDFLYGSPGTLSEYDSKTILGVTGVSAARIHFFYMGCENFYGSLLKSISIPRPQSGFPLQDTDTAHIQPVWLYGDCYDENGELVDTIVSETSAQQLDDEFVTTWSFNNRVRGYWKKIKFGISLTETPTDEDRNPPIKSRILLCQTINKSLSAGGWGIINQDNVNDSDKTLNFQIGVFNKLNTNIKGHIENTEIHVTQADKDRWDRGNNVEVVQLTAGDFINITDNAISVNTSLSLSNDANTVPTTAAVYAHSNDNSLHVTSSLTSEVAKISTLQTTVNNHIGDASHLTDAQKSSISQISTISSDLNTHKTNGGTLHVTSDEKSKWSGHVDDDTLHVSATYKQDIANAIASFEQHESDEDIHFSKAEIMDNVAGSLETWDMSLGAAAKGAQGIAYAQICNTHVLQQGSYLTKITVPQHTNPQASEVTTGVDLYLVIFGDNEDSASSDETKWEFVACSTNEGQQQVGGNSNTKPDMVFEFEKGIDLGLYRRYRFFYVTDRSVTPTLPTVFGSGYTGVKMAFPSRGIDTNCKVRMTGGGWASSHTYPAIITFIKDSAELRSINHKENDEKHLTVGFRETVSTAISKISEIEQKIDDINFVLGVEKQEYTTFSSELPVPTDVTNQDTTQILLASSRCVSGKIRKIEIPYVKGKGTTGYLAVQIINAGESANVAKTLEETYFSTNTVTQTNNQSGTSTFYFDNLFIPSDFYAIRFSFVPNKETVPEYGGNNCLTYAIRLVSITESDYYNPVYNHDGYKVFNPATQGYGYSTVDYGVVVTVESVKSSFDSIIKDLYTLKKTIS